METRSLKCYYESPFVYSSLFFFERKIWQKLVWPHCSEDGDPEVMVGYSLSHWGRDEIDAILQTPFSNAFSWMKMYELHFCQYQAGMPILEKKFLLMQLTICMILIQNVSKWLLRMLHMPWQLCCRSMWKSLKWLDKPIGIELHKTWKSNCQWKIVDKMCLWISCGACGFFLNPVKSGFNSLRPSDVIWWQRSGSTLAQVMACGLTAPSHYLNQCWLIISKV